ncbi:hypothetical protein O5D80_003584 [Batrachochytrium dendrobatidis]|nr:hypothetical protein O5D80_003584 [Batrachochytrium dendrobatidis]
MGQHAKVFLRMKPLSSQRYTFNDFSWSVDTSTRTITVPDENKNERKKTFQFDHILDVSESVETLFQEAILPQVKICLNGFNVSLIFVGASKSGKSYALEGAMGKNKKMPAWVRDLLNPQRDGLQVDTSSATGVAVTGLSTRRISDVETCMDAIERSQLHRLGNSSKASDRSFVLYMFEINKFLENDSTLHSPTKSKFTVVDFCALDHFFTDPTQLLMKEGTNVGNSIIACHKTIKQVALQKKIAPEAEQTPITRLLLEEFGGNCYTNFLFSMDYLEAKAMNLNLLNFSELLRKIETYPICNDETFFHLVSLVQERAGHIGKRAALVEIPTNQKQLLVDLNERINVVIEQNTTMQKELILKERLLLDTQKTQLDLEIEQNLQLEAAENKISDLLDRLAFYEKAENNLNSTCSIQDQKTVNEKLYAQVLQLNVQVAQLEAIIQQTSKDLQASLLKNEELGLEMIALINQNEDLTIKSLNETYENGTLIRHRLKPLSNTASIHTRIGSKR